MWKVVVTCVLAAIASYFVGLLRWPKGDAWFDLTWAYVGLPPLAFSIASVAWNQPLYGVRATTDDLDESNVDVTLHLLKEKYIDWLVWRGARRTRRCSVGYRDWRAFCSRRRTCPSIAQIMWIIFAFSGTLLQIRMWPDSSYYFNLNVSMMLMYACGYIIWRWKGLPRAILSRTMMLCHFIYILIASYMYASACVCVCNLTSDVAGVARTPSTPCCICTRCQ